MTDADARAETLDLAALKARPVLQRPPEQSLSVEAAYAVQARLVARRLARGERLVGLKLGLTSEAKMKQVGVTEVILGRLTDAMQHDQGSTIDLGALIHPRVEPEIAFLLRCRRTLARSRRWTASRRWPRRLRSSIPAMRGSASIWAT